MLMRLLVSAAVAWPLVAGAAVWSRVSAHDHGVPMWTALVYAVSSKICHQRPERSFHTADVAWPVCARCSGLYLAAPFGAAALLFTRRRSRGAGLQPLGAQGLQPLWIFGLATVPTALTLFWEWGGMGTPSNLIRLSTALPLGAAIMWLLVDVTREPRVNQVN
jgi:uncharacterized membrane protein